MPKETASVALERDRQLATVLYLSETCAMLEVSSEMAERCHCCANHSSVVFAMCALVVYGLCNW